MLLMLKSLVIALLLSSVLEAGVTNKDVEGFLKRSYAGNKNIKSITIKVVNKSDVKGMKGWSAFIVDVFAVLNKDNRKVKQKMIWFSNGVMITPDLINIKTGESVKDLVAPPFKNEYYKKSNLIYGDLNAKHKVAIFSDPLCPFCKSFVPGAIEYMKKRPKLFAIYYYHFPLPSLHPAAVELVKAAQVAQLQGKKDVVLKLYSVKLDNPRERNPRERNVSKILSAFNKTFGTNIKESDINTPQIQKHFMEDLNIAESVMVQGTPTMFFDGKIDKQKKKYLKVK